MASRRALSAAARRASAASRRCACVEGSIENEAPVVETSNGADSTGQERSSRLRMIASFRSRSAAALRAAAISFLSS
eukprot:scaffold26096_cov31-Tisochrysis_lutea.AAC.5